MAEPAGQAEPLRGAFPVAGMVDFHVHAAPDVRPRKCDAYDLAQAAAAQDMRGLVLKSHTVSTTEMAGVTQRASARLRVVGGVTLNHAVGGLNPAAVEASLGAGGRIVWFPTQDARNDYEHRGLPGDGALTIFDATGELLPAVHEILALCAEEAAVLCTGHLAPGEITALHEQARSHGVERFVVTHPDHRHVELALDDQRELAGRGALMERVIPRDEDCALTLDEVVARIAAVGARQNVLGSDLGQAHSPHPVRGYGDFLGDLQGRGVSDGDIAFMGGELAGQLLGLDAPFSRPVTE